MLVGGLPFPPGIQGLKPCNLRLETLYFLRCTRQRVASFYDASGLLFYTLRSSPKGPPAFVPTSLVSLNPRMVLAMSNIRVLACFSKRNQGNSSNATEI
jgi:hypothetical protein